MKRFCLGFILALCLAVLCTAGCVSTASPRPSTAIATPSPVSNASLTPMLDFAALARYMLELVNRDRQGAGLSPVEWDDTAALAAQSHAEEMVAYEYMSHWDLNGYGPDHRYAFAGGRDCVRENIYSYYRRWPNGAGVPIEDWHVAIEQAQETLMGSAGHRDNIVQASHTHVGIGIAYESQRGELRIVQEFVDHYVILDPLPGEVRRGDTVEVVGTLLPGVSSPLINLARESFPSSQAIEDLNRTSMYNSAASVYVALNPVVNGDRFTAPVHFTAADAPGLYHIRIWVVWGGEQVLANDAILRLR